MDIKKFYSKLTKEKAHNGIYDLKSIIKYDDKEVETSRQMTLGQPEIKILAFEKFFKENTINKFNIDLENTWNQKIENIYATIELMQNEKPVIAPARTTSIDIQGRDKSTLKSYLDLTGISKGEYMCRLTIDYNGLQTQELQKVKVMTESEYRRETGQYTLLIILLIAIIGLLMALLIIFILFIKKKQ